MSSYPREYFPAVSFQIGSESTVPVFIIGFFRSGSTLLETMLDAHRDVYSVAEYSSFAYQSMKMIEIMDSKKYQLKDPHVLKSIVAKTAKNTLRMMRRKLRDTHQGDISLTNNSKIIDKMLFNYKNLALIHLIFPNAVILHTVRDPMDTLFSCYKTKFNRMDKHVYALDLKHLTLEYAIYLKIMHHFKTILPPGRIIDVSYEELVMNPTKVMKTVVKDALQLPWDPSVLEYHKLNRTVHTASVLQVKQKLYKDSIGGWTKYSRELRDIKHELKKHLPVLAAQGALEPAYLNWELDSTFNYKEMLKAFKDIY
jgi:hypothetical protein